MRASLRSNFVRAHVSGLRKPLMGRDSEKEGERWLRAANSLCERLMKEKGERRRQEERAISIEKEE